MAIDERWLLTQTNIRYLRNAADGISEDEDIPYPVRRKFQELENILKQVENILDENDF